MRWKHHMDTHPAPGEIDPARLMGWFQEAVEGMNLPDEVLEYIIGYDVINIQDLLVYGARKVLKIWMRDSGKESVPDIKVTSRALDKAADVIGSKICHFPGWQEERPIVVSWDDRQYNALMKGYAPDWDMRFATFHRRGNFYIYRSGNILKKFRVKRSSDGLWHITRQYTTSKEGLEFMMGEVIYSGYWEVSLGNRG